MKRDRKIAYYMEIKLQKHFYQKLLAPNLLKEDTLIWSPLYEYGSRRGFWRIHELFQEKRIPATIFGVGMALERNKEVCNAIKQSDYEVASHGWRWIDYQNVPKAKEKKDMQLSIQSIKKIFGQRPLGWYTGRCSPNTRDLVMEEGGFLYDSDSYSDDLPYWEVRGKKKQLIVPYTLDNNDMRFATYQGFNSGDQFYTYLKDSFDALYSEGHTQPKNDVCGIALSTNRKTWKNSISKKIFGLCFKTSRRLDM